MLTIEIVYSTPNKQTLRVLTMPENATILEAIQQSGILQTFPDIDLKKNKIGIFGEFTSLTHHLRNYDRIEIYRPLLIDPKQARLNRVHKAARLP